MIQWSRWCYWGVCGVLTVGSVAAQSLPSVNALLEAREVRGQLLPKRYTTLAAEIPAKVLKVEVLEGGSFKAGQTLIAFDCALQQSQHDKAQAALHASTMTVTANRELIQYQAVGKVELQNSESELQKNQAEANAAAAVLGKCQIKAPFDGRVTEQKVRDEQFAQSGQALLEVMDDSVLELEFIAPSSWLTRLRTVRAVVRIRIDETGRTYSARVIRLGAKVDPVSQSIKAVAVIEGRSADLMPGMSGRVSLGGN